jgi:hypothetical protein
LSVDPLTKEYAMLTPYQFASNTPIQAIDLDGLEAYFPNQNTGNTEVQKQNQSDIKKTTTFVISLGIQGGLSLSFFGEKLSLWGNLGSFDLIGVRNGKFVFLQGSRREVKIEVGPVTVVSMEQERTYTEDENMNRTTTTTTTVTGGLSVVSQGVETTEVDVSQGGSYVPPTTVEKKESHVRIRSVGFKIGFGIAFEFSKDEKHTETNN